MPFLSLSTPVGDITLFEEDGKIVSLDLGLVEDDEETPLLQEAARQIDAYFAGTLTTFSLPMAPAGTSFQQKVWAVMQRIPYGQVLSYGDVAKELSSSPRAVGGACGRNPIPLLIPCHRILGKNGALGGYSGLDGLETKEFLLTLEGVRFQKGHHDHE